MPDKNDRQSVNRARRLVRLFLSYEGVPVEEPPVASKLSERLAESYPASDFTGLERWAFIVRDDATNDLGGALDSARNAARQDGKPRAAAIFHRKERNTGDAFVVITLETFTGILCDEIQSMVSLDPPVTPANFADPHS